MCWNMEPEVLIWLVYGVTTHEYECLWLDIQPDATAVTSKYFTKKFELADYKSLPGI